MLRKGRIDPSRGHAGHIRPAVTRTETLLRRLLDEWQRTHDPALEDPIDRIGAELARVRGSLRYRTNAELEATWLAHAEQADSCDVTRLLDAAWIRSWEIALARARALARFPPDPRFGAKLLRVATWYPSWKSEELHRTLAELLNRSPTPRMIPDLDAMRGFRFHALYAGLRRLIDEQETRPADPALIEEALEDRDPDPDGVGLFAQHVHEPGDLALRAVLADALQNAEDPRGEFIMLQTAIADGRATLATRRRAAELLAAHADEWTGLLPRVDPLSRRFERGFLVGVRSLASGDALAQTFDAREWATIQDLDIEGRECELEVLLRRMPLLHTLSTPHDRVLERIGATGPYPVLRAIGCGFEWMPPDRRAFPSLAVLGGQWITFRFDATEFRELQRAAAGLAIQAIVHVDFPVDHLGDALRERSYGPPETRFTIGPTGRPSFAAPGWRVRVSRDQARAQLSWSGGRSSWRPQAVAILGQLAAAGIRDIVFGVDTWTRKAIEADIRAAAERLRISLSVDRSTIDLAAPAQS